MLQVQGSLKSKSTPKNFVEIEVTIRVSLNEIEILEKTTLNLEKITSLVLSDETKSSSDRR